jgi:hypothetical protein
MGGKSDIIRYASEIPSVLAWDQSYSSNEFEKAKHTALSISPEKYIQNYAKAQYHMNAIKADMNIRSLPKVDKVSWQANDNRNNNGSPSDIVFENHQVGGVSIKHGSDIILNSGIKDFSTTTGRPRGVDLFRHLATVEFDNLLCKVIRDCINELSVGQSWTEDRKEGYGKYAITRLSEDQFKLKFSNVYKNFTTAELLSWTMVSKHGIKKQIPGKWGRVFGDYFQGRKKLYQIERDALYKVLYPQLEALCKQIVLSDSDKLCQIGGFTEKPHYVSDLYKDQIYFVPKKSELLNRLELTIVNPANDKTFGSGFELRCQIKIAGSSEYATLDFYICYNSGTFNRGPVIKVQNFQGKSKLWTRIL